MRDDRFNVVLVFLANSVVLLWTVLPFSGEIQPYPLSEQIIDARSYIWIGTIYAAFLILTWAMFRASDSRTHDFFHAAFILQALQFVEYWINYNETWTKILGYPVTIATLRFPLLFFFAVRTFFKWKT